jgi:putative SOS response-associated peptidase YedK
MCGRYQLHADPELVARAFGLEFSQTGRDLGAGVLRPRYNIAPTQHVPIVRNWAGDQGSPSSAGRTARTSASWSSSAGA